MGGACEPSAMLCDELWRGCVVGVDCLDLEAGLVSTVFLLKTALQIGHGRSQDVKRGSRGRRKLWVRRGASRMVIRQTDRVGVRWSEDLL